jgi:hypothetical protein
MTYSVVPVEWLDIGANGTRMVNLNLPGEFQDYDDPVSYPDPYAEILKGLVTF